MSVIAVTAARALSCQSGQLGQLVGLLVTACLAVALLAPTTAPALAQTFPGKIGVQLGDPNEGARNRAYVDIARGHRPFRLNDGTGPTPKDSLGWPTTDGHTVIFDARPVAAWTGEANIDDPDRFVPNFSGTYKCSFTGQADVVVREGGFTITNKLYNSSTNTTTFDMNVPAPSTTNMNDNIVVLQFNNTRRTSSSALNTGITNLKAIRPGYHATPNQLFTNEFINSLGPFQYLRLMDWVETNANPGYYGDTGNHKINWAHRKKPDAATQQYLGGDAHGACWEHALLLCNQANKDIWVNIPVNATDEYITGLANLIKNGNSYTGNVGLNSGLKIYVEHSNEVWNFSFPQYTYNKLAAVDEASNDPGSPLDNDGTTDQEVLARRRHAKRTRDAVKIFESVFGANTINSKIFGVYSHWTIQPAQYNATLSWMNSTYGPPSGYFYGMGQTVYFNENDASDTATVTEILNAMRNDSDSHVPMTQQLKTVANNWGLQLVAYEAGPDTGGGSTVNVANRIRAERDPEMKNLIERNVRTNWFPHGGDLYTQFAHASGYSRYGCWGATEDVMNINTYKYQAIYSLTGYAGANQVAAPSFSPVAGTYSSAQSVTISTSTSGASIRYTTNGTNPTSTTGTLYSGPVSIGATTTLKAIAYKSGMTDSAVTSGTYTISTGGTQGTYGNNGNPWSIASSGATRIQAENYDTGGQNVAYNDADTTNDGGAYRTGEGVDVQATTDTGGGYNVGWVAAGEWLEYTVNVAAAGTYDIKLRVARQTTGTSTVRVLFNGVDKTGSMSVPSTGAWQTFTTITASGVSLSAGQQVMRIDMTGSSYNLNWAELTPAATAPAAPTGLAATAGDAQVGLSWSASTGATSYGVYFTTGGNFEPAATGLTATSYVHPNLTNGTQYTYYVTASNGAGESSPSNTVSATPSAGSTSATYQAEDATLSGCTISSGNTGYTGTGFADYGGSNTYVEFAVSQTGSATLSFRYANGSTGNRQCAVTVNGVSAGTVSFAPTGGWSTWQTTTLNVTLASSGTSAVRVTANSSGGPNLDKMDVSGTTSSAVAAPSFSPSAGTYSSAQSVSINSSTSGASIRYTVNGSTPTATTGTLYSGPVTINQTTTLKAIAFKSGMTDSSVTSGTYTITSPLTYQAEDATLSGCTIASGNTGYTGTGFADYGGSGTYVEWDNVNRNAGGTVTLTLRHANGSTQNRSCDVIVNGSAAGAVSFAPTGGWSTWGTATIDVSLNAGSNTIRVTANSTAGGPNLDKMDVGD